MAAFHLRDIPPSLYERLRQRATSEGRSINAQILTILERDLSQPSPDEVMQRLERLRRRVRLSPDARRPEELIREDRDAH